MRILTATSTAMLMLLPATLALGAPPHARTAAAGQAPSVPAGQAQVGGKLVDAKSKLLRTLGLDRGCQGPLSARARKRVTGYLDALGYKLALLRCTPQGARIEIRPYRVVRKIYIKGNWPLFEEEILRRLRFRPGQRLPEGKALAEAIQRQEARMRDYLSREGYFDGSLRIKISPTDVPHQVNLEIRVRKGRSYKVGQVVARPMGRRRGARKRLAISRDDISDMFIHGWFYRDSFNTKRFNEDVQRLIARYHSMGYPGVRVRKSYRVVQTKTADRAVRIDLQIQERKRIDIDFRGNRSIRDAELRRALTLFDEGAYDDYELAQSAQRIHKLYQSKGYLQARVSFQRDVGQHVDRVAFTIHEGPKLKIRKIEFLGNKHVSDAALRKVIKSKPFPLLGAIGLGEGGFITSTQLMQDAERIRQHYVAAGFPDAKARGEIAPNQALMGRPGALAAAVAAGTSRGGDLYVRFTIDEGKRATVEGVVISGNHLFPAARLRSQLAIKPGRPFSAKALALDKARLARIYGENGHPYAEIRSLEEVSLDGTQVTVQFTVLEGPKVRFGEVFVRGNFKTRTHVIRGDLELQPGDPFDIRKIERAEAQLRRRQLFNMVRVQLLGIGDKERVLPVLISVEERYDDYGTIDFGIGGSTDNLLFGSLGYTNRNVLGFGTSLTLKGEVGMKIQSGNIHYRDPRIFGSSVILDVQGYLRNQITERLGEVLTFGGTLSVSKELLPHLTGLARYEIRQVKHKEDILRPAGVDEAGQVDVLTRTGGIGPALVYDRRDNPLSPTRGYRLEGSMLWASTYLGGTQHFVKFNVSGQVFIPLPKDITIAAAVRYDHGLPLGGDVQLPKVERYFAGGDTTIRGFEEDMAWAEVVRSNVPPYSNATLYTVRPQGGNIRLLTNVELQFPIWKESILFGLPLMGALFADNGVLTNSFEGFDAHQFRHGAGAALRIVTPVGFSSFEYAFALDPEPWDPKDGRFHFNFGFVF